MATYDLTSTTPTSFATGDILNCPYSGKPQSITLPKGTFKLECWGAQSIYSSASYSTAFAYGYGGYATGTITLSAPTTLYLYVGGRPYYSTANSATATGDTYTGGWNGGGGSYYGSSYNDNGPGGGATDICLVYSDVSLYSYKRYVRTSASYLSRLIVAGGGGGGRGTNAYAEGGYAPTISTSDSYAGGMSSVPSLSYGVTAGFGYGGTGNSSGDDYGGGGGGWYGGQSAGDSGGGGGSSFVWCSNYASYAPSGYTPTSDLYMTDVSCINGNATQPSATTVGSTETGHAGNGFIRITVNSVQSAVGFYKKSDGWNEIKAVYKKADGTWSELTSAQIKKVL